MHIALKGSLILIAVLIFLALGFFVFIFAKLIFAAQIAEWNVSRATPYAIDSQDITLKDITPVNTESFHGNYNALENIRSSYRVYIDKNNKIIQGKENLPPDYRNAQFIAASKYNTKLVIDRNKVYATDGDNLKELIFEFDEYRNAFINSAHVLDENKLLLDTSFNNGQESHLVELSLDRKKIRKINKDLRSFPSYGYHSIRIFEPEHFNGKLVVYYTGTHMFAFGGDSVRPKFSHLMQYNENHPDGLKLLKLAYNSGIIINIEYKGGNLILTGDRNRPRMVKDFERNMSYWQVTPKQGTFNDL